MKSPYWPDIEVKHYATREEWLAARKSGVIGGSDAATIMGANPYKQPFMLWKEMRDGAPEFDNDAMYWGRALEPAIRAAFSERERVSVATLDNAILYRPEMPWAVASVDGAIVGKTPADIYEGKTSNNPDAWGLSDSDTYPEQYLWQCQHYMSVTGAQLARLVVLLFGRDYRTYRIPADKSLIDALRTAQMRFMEHVKSGIAPEVDMNAADALEAVRAQYGWQQDKAVELPGLTLADYLYWKNVHDGAKGELDKHRVLVEAAMAGASKGVAEVQGVRYAVSNTRSFRTVYDVPPEIKANFARPSETPTFTLRVTEKKK